MHAQLQCNRTFLKIPLRNPDVIPAVHHLSEWEHTLGVAAHCPGSNDNTSTKSRQWGCMAPLRDKNTNNEGRKTMPVKRGGGMIPPQWWSSSFPTQAGNRANPKAMQVCKWEKCRFLPYCKVASVKRRQKPSISSMMQVFVCIPHDFYIPSAARWRVHKQKNLHKV